MLVWGAGDPYVELSVAQRFAANRAMPLTIIGDAGHWAIAQRPHAVAAALHAFWNSL